MVGAVITAFLIGLAIGVVATGALARAEKARRK